MNEKELVIFDVETTGLSPAYGDRIVEFAALKIALPLSPIKESGRLGYDMSRIRKIGTFSSLVKVSKDISYGAFLVNGITPAMLEDAPRAQDIYPELLEFIKGCCLVGHNVRFDIKFLRSELGLLDLDWVDGPLTFIDTVKMARRLLPGLGKYSLWNLVRFLGIEDSQRHRAMADVDLTFKVFLNLLVIADRKDICEIDELVNLGGKTLMMET